MIESTAPVPEQHQTVTTVPGDETEFGIGTRPGGDLKRSAGKTSQREESQLPVDLTKRLHDPLRWLAGSGAWCIEAGVRPEQQLELHGCFLQLEGQLGRLTPLQDQVPVEGVETTLPSSEVTEQAIPLTVQNRSLSNAQAMARKAMVAAIQKAPPGKPDGDMDRGTTRDSDRWTDMDQPNLPEVEAIRKAAYVST